MQRKMKRLSEQPRWIELLTFIFVMTLLAPTVGLNAEEGDDEAFAIAKGRVTYRVYCINCHGAKAQGDGTLAEMLTTKPSNLTLLSKENDGEFPAEQTRQIIDGREGVRGHGMKEMPVWGDVFQTSGLEPSGQDETGEERSKRKVEELVLYLKSIQEP